MFKFQKISKRKSKMSCAVVLLLLTALPTLLAAPSLGIHFKRPPESAIAPRGDEVLFECELDLGPENLEWTFRRLKSTTTSGYSKLQYLSNDSINYNITNAKLVSKLRVYVTTETLGEYRCIASYGSVTLASTTAHLSLATISINDTEPKTTTTKTFWNVTPKNYVVLRCGNVNSQPAAVWSFYRNGEKLQQNEMSATSGALVLSSVTAQDNGDYSCSAANTVTSEVVKLPRLITLRVEHNNEARKAPYFLDAAVATRVIVRAGENTVLECPGVAEPMPKAVWSSPDVANIHNNRTQVLPYGFKIVDVRIEDAGKYICRLDNGVAKALVHTIILRVHEPPKIVAGPVAKATNEDEPLQLLCNATGQPRPELYWLINGETITHDSEAIPFKGGLSIRHVQKRHAGIVQCFARNALGEDSASTLLFVNPKQIQSDVDSGSTKKPGKRKFSKAMHMVPPSAPNVTRLSDESVMLRWQVPKNDGLPIQFFKVQYRMLGDNARKIARENWQTTNEDIPFGKRNRNADFGKIFTSSVTGLKADCFYRFRIIAVYSNDDNKESNTSAKFLLQSGASLGVAETNLPVPELNKVEPYSETAVMLHWSLAANHDNSVEGFYAYYRPSSSAGEYFKTTIEAAQSRKFKVGTLEPGTIYEFKLQSFNSLTASEFSVLKQGRTLNPKTTPAPTTTPVTSTTPASNETYTMFPLLAGAVSGGTLLLIAVVAACLCIRRRSNTQAEDEDKPQLEPMRDDFVPLGAYAHKQKSRQRLNGVRPHMHITLNPLSQHEDKTSPGHLPQSHEQAFFQQRQPNNQGYDATDANYNGRLSSLRRSHRSLERGGNNNNHTYETHTVGGGVGAGSSPKAGLVMHKRARLSSRSDTLSSGSLNSVGV